MITGIGIDIVQIKRMERWLFNKNLLDRYFHPGELDVISSRGKGAAASLAARFAAKEAFGKALGTGLFNLSLKDIMVVNKENGRPEIKLFLSAEKAMQKSGATNAHISITHEKDHAIAMIVLEKA